MQLLRRTRPITVGDERHHVDGAFDRIVDRTPMIPTRAVEDVVGDRLAW